MKRLRILILGPDCDPEGVSTGFVSFQHAAALARTHQVTIAVRAGSEAVVRRSAPFHAVAALRSPLLDPAYTWVFRKVLRSNYSSQWRTALGYPRALAFELRAWRRFSRQIKRGDFDVVHRVAPVSGAVPSPFAWFLRRGPIPFVIGPINGGLPWPSGFPQSDAQRERISRFRDLCWRLPFARSTYRYAKAVLVGSSHKASELAKFQEKLFFVPENGVPAPACREALGSSAARGPLKILFVAGLAPIKGCDLALRAAAPLARRGAAVLTVVGDGPERQRLEKLAQSLGTGARVTFTGWVSHEEVFVRMRGADVLIFPSLRDFGGGVVFEALASGAVPVVVDFGGPGDIVNESVGIKVPLTNEADVVAQLSQALQRLDDDRSLLARLRKNGIAYASERLTWDAKARQTTQILEWVTGRGPKPDLPAPKRAVAPENHRPAHAETSAGAGG